MAELLKCDRCSTTVPGRMGLEVAMDRNLGQGIAGLGMPATRTDYSQPSIATWEVIKGTLLCARCRQQLQEWLKPIPDPS